MGAFLLPLEVDLPPVDRHSSVTFSRFLPSFSHFLFPFLICFGFFSLQWVYVVFPLSWVLRRFYVVSGLPPPHVDHERHGTSCLINYFPGPFPSYLTLFFFLPPCCNAFTSSSHASFSSSNLQIVLTLRISCFVITVYSSHASASVHVFTHRPPFFPPPMYSLVSYTSPPKDNPRLYAFRHSTPRTSRQAAL